MRIWSNEELEFIKQRAKEGDSRRVIAEKLNENFGTSYTASQIINLMKRKKITNDGGGQRRYSKEEIDFLKENYVLYERQQLLALFNSKFPPITLTQLIGCIKNHSLKSGRTGQLGKGHSLNQVPIGTEKIWNEGTKNKYVGIKIGEPSVWMHKHIYVYEKAYGKIPDSQIVIFLDGNTLNCELDNLMAIDKRVNVIMNKKRLPRKTREETLCSIAIASLIAIISDAEKRRNK